MVLIGLLVAPTLASAQLSSVQTGSRVRVHAPTLSTKQVVGTLAMPIGETVALDAPTPGTPPDNAARVVRQVIPIPALLELHVSRGQSHREGMKRGAKIGLLVGGLYTVAAVVSSRSSVRGGWGPPAAFAFGAGFTVASTAIGALVGSRFSVESWKRVYSAAPPRSTTRY